MTSAAILQRVQHHLDPDNHPHHPVAFVASYGRGYLPALGFAIFTVFLGQISGVLGWGGYVPWAIPALYSGAAGPRADFLFPGSFPIVIVTSLLGLIATFWWWKTADQRE